MINLKSLQTALGRATYQPTSEGPYSSITLYALYQNPSRLPVSGTCTGSVISSSIPVVLGKRVNLTSFSVTGERFMIPNGAGFRVAATLTDALAGVSQPVANGSGTVFEESITAEDYLGVLKSFQVATTISDYLQTPAYSVEGDRVYMNPNLAYLNGPIPNLSHILSVFSEDYGGAIWWSTYTEPLLVYGLNPTPATSVASGQTMIITVRPYMRSL